MVAILTSAQYELYMFMMIGTAPLSQMPVQRWRSQSGAVVGSIKKNVLP